MKQRFLNQKLGKRMSRKAELQKAKAALFRARQGCRKTKSIPPGGAGEAPAGPARPGTSH